MKLPTFIIAGCGKAGTTSLYRYLEKHPDVFMSVPKEPRYFFHPDVRPGFCGPMDEERYNSKTVYKWDDYCALFEFAENFLEVGEASPVYMVSDAVPSEIQKKLPNTKIVIMLRNPIEIAFSAYNHQLREGDEWLNFEAALDAEPERVNNNWAWHWRYTEIGKAVPDVLSEYLRIFPKEKVKVVFYDDFKKDNYGVLKDLFAWLEIDSAVTLQSNRANDGGVYKHAQLKKYMNRVTRSSIWKISKHAIPAGFKDVFKRQLNKRTYPCLPIKTRKRLVDTFEETIQRVSEITESDLSHWLVVPSD